MFVVLMLSLVCADIRMLYADDYCEPAEPRPIRKQTNPPSIPISQLYPDKNFPAGLCVPYIVSYVQLYHSCRVYSVTKCAFERILQNDQVAAQRFTSEEKRALERIQEDIYSDFRRAAEAHRYSHGGFSCTKHVCAKHTKHLCAMFGTMSHFFDLNTFGGMLMNFLT